MDLYVWGLFMRPQSTWYANVRQKVLNESSSKWRYRGFDRNGNNCATVLSEPYYKNWPNFFSKIATFWNLECVSKNDFQKITTTQLLAFSASWFFFATSGNTLVPICQFEQLTSHIHPLLWRGTNRGILPMHLGIQARRGNEGFSFSSLFHRKTKQFTVTSWVHSDKIFCTSIT